MSREKKTRRPKYQRLIDVIAQVMNRPNTRNVYSHNELSVCVRNTTDLLYCRFIYRYLISYRPLAYASA